MAFAAQGVAVGWHLYALTGSALDLGLLGLVVVPAHGGPDAGGRPRRRPARPAHDCRRVPGDPGTGRGRPCGRNRDGRLDRGTIFARHAASASARAFEWPTMAALLPSLVQRGMLPVATAWATTANQLAQIGGPALGGFLYALTPGGAFATPSVLFICAALLTSRIPGAAPAACGKCHADLSVFMFFLHLFAAPAGWSRSSIRSESYLAAQWRCCRSMRVTFC